uniref:Putative rap1a member of ras oncoprotein family n=1 Tax=Ixodes ricinus TaxID=34613 RepID=V5GIS6_IXORI
MRDLYMKNGAGLCACLLHSQPTSTFQRPPRPPRTDPQSQRHGRRSHDPDWQQVTTWGTRRVVGKDQGINLARNFSNCAFLESSAKAKINVSEIFYDLVRQINRKNPEKKMNPKKKTKCVLL